MDPEETLFQIVAALKAAEWDLAKEHIDGLREWHVKGGFLPKGDR
jgi:hypothetical protein